LVDLASMTRVQITSDFAHRRQQTCAESALVLLARILSDRKSAKGSVGLARSRSPTELWQD